MRITSPGRILVAAWSRISFWAAVTRSRMNMSISSTRSRLASASGVEGSILMMTVIIDQHIECIEMGAELTVFEPPNGIAHANT